MRTTIIAVPCVEATPPSGGRAAGLAQASEAYLASGLPHDIGAHGIDVTTIRWTLLPDDHISDDPIANLGRLNALVGEAAAEGIACGAPPLLLGGTCSHLIGMLAGLQNAYGATARVGLVWFDAHGDFNTPHTSHSGMLGGMPVAVAAGLCHAPWREIAGMLAPLPTDRILLVDVRNLDPEEAVLIAATDAAVARFGTDGDVAAVAAAVAGLAARVDHLYLHVDADVLDAAYQPNHPSVEPNGPDVETVAAALRIVMSTGLVRAFGVVSVDPTGPDGARSLRSGRDLVLAGMTAWAPVAAGV